MCLADVKYLVVAVVLVVAACGKKHKNVFFFNKVVQKKPTFLTIPSVRGVVARHCRQGVRITWHHIDRKVKNKKFVGYNIYRLTLWGVIPRKPLNRVVCREKWFIDTIKQDSSRRSYVIRAVFYDALSTVLGPVSKVTPVKKK